MYTYLPTYLPACLPACLPAYLATYLPTYLHIHTHGHLRAPFVRHVQPHVRRNDAEAPSRMMVNCFFISIMIIHMNYGFINKLCLM